MPNRQAVRGKLTAKDGKITLAWNLPRLLLPKNRVKLLLNLLVIAQQTIPRGGVLTVDPLGEGETMGFQITAAGLNARVSQPVAELLASGPTGAVDAHAVQPYYTRLLADACGIRLSGLVALVAPSASLVGGVQVASRSFEQAIITLGRNTDFDLTTIIHGYGRAPIPPVIKDEVLAMGRINDALVYGGTTGL